MAGNKSGDADRKPRADKGKKRHTYRKRKQGVPQQRAVFTNLLRNLQDIERLEAKANQPAYVKRKRGTDPKLQRERRQAVRTELLDKLCRNRVCPMCKNKHYKCRAWVQIDDAIVICKGCHKKLKERIENFVAFVKTQLQFEMVNAFMNIGNDMLDIANKAIYNYRRDLINEICKRKRRAASTTIDY